MDSPSILVIKARYGNQTNVDEDGCSISKKQALREASKANRQSLAPSLGLSGLCFERETYIYM